MAMKTSHILTTAVALALAATVPYAGAEGWSLFPSSSSSTSEKKPTEEKTTTKSVPKKSPYKMTTKKPPSTLDKMGTGTKKFFTNVGDTLTGKKATTPATNQYTLGHSAQPAKKSTSWNPFHHEEPKQRKTLNDFWEQERLDP